MLSLHRLVQILNGIQLAARLGRGKVLPVPVCPVHRPGRARARTTQLRVMNVVGSLDFRVA